MCVRAKLLQLCPTLCNPMDHTLPDDSVPGFLQNRMLEWVAMPSSRGSSHPRIEPSSLVWPQLAGGFFTTSTTSPIHLVPKHSLWPFPEKAMAPHSSTLAWKSHGWRSLVGCSPWGCEELDTTGRLHFHFSLSCIGEGNGNPLQCSCLENPRDGGAWWAAISRVAQSQTWLKQLSSSSSSRGSLVSLVIGTKILLFFFANYGYSQF